MRPDAVWQGWEICSLGLSLPDTTSWQTPLSIMVHLRIEFRCSIRSLFNKRLQAGRAKSIRVGAAIETYSTV